MNSLKNKAEMTARLTHGHYMNIGFPTTEKVVAEYVWIDGTGINLRSKCRTLDSKIDKLEEIPEWNYDGSSTKQATTESSEVILKPVSFFPDPFRGGDNILVLCSTYRVVGDSLEERIPTCTNFRHQSERMFSLNEHKDKPWFGLEQEYTLFDRLDDFSKQPLGWPKGGFPAKEGPYYCSVGVSACHGRVVMDLHYQACITAKIAISGTNTESSPGTYEFQIGPCEGIEAGDHLWMARYILWRVTEDLNIGLSFHPKAIDGWSGTGLHTNMSTKQMRKTGGYDAILTAIEKLEPEHKRHLVFCGEGNEKRLLGKHKTCSMKEFTYGVSNRNASIRIPTPTFKNESGYFEDRRPGSNADPYVVTASLYSTICLDNKGLDELEKHYLSWVEELTT